MATQQTNDTQQSHDKGKNLGQGLAGVTGTERRDLAGRGDKAPSKDQEDLVTSGEQGQQPDDGTSSSR